MTRLLDELLFLALEVPGGDERDARIATACGGDAALAEELRGLIAAHEALPPSFLAPPEWMSASGD